MKKIKIFTADYSSFWWIWRHVLNLEKILKQYWLDVEVFFWRSLTFSVPQFLKQLILSLFWQLCMIFSRPNCDIINIQTCSGGVFFIPLFFKWKFIATAHHTYYQQIILMRQWYKALFIILEFFVLHASDKVITVSESTASYLLKIYRIPKHKIYFIPNSMPNVLFHSKQKKSRKTNSLLFIWRFEKRKNPIFMIELIKKLSQMNHEFTLHMIWDGLLLPECKKLTKKYSLQDRVIFYGHSSEKVKEKLLKSCDFLIIPSVFEWQGIIFLEGISFGIKVLCSDCDGLRDLCPLENIFKDQDDLITKILEGSYIHKIPLRGYKKYVYNTKYFAKVVDIYG